MGFMVSFLNDELKLYSRCIGNFLMCQSRGAQETCDMISEVVGERLGNRVPEPFVSDSAPKNKAAALWFMKMKEEMTIGSRDMFISSNVQ